MTIPGQPPPFAPSPYYGGEHPEPLTGEQLSQITHARERYRPVRRAISVASFDAWTTAVFAGLSLLFSLVSFSLPGLLVSLALCAISVNSFTALRALKQFDLGAPRRLALGQIAIAASLTLYAGYNLFRAATDTQSSELAQLAQQNPEIASTVAGLEPLLRDVTYAVYIGVILATLVAQGLTAFYYHTRRKHLETHLTRTAPWVLQMQRAGFRL